MSINSFNESMHRQNINNIRNSTNSNYIASNINNAHATALFKESSSLYKESSTLTLQFMNEQEKRYQLSNYNKETIKKIFFHFKSIISEIEASVELLNRIAKDKPELYNFIKSSISEHNKIINSSENVNKELASITNAIFK